MDLFSSFLDRMLGRSYSITFLARVYVLYRVMTLDVAPLNDALFRRRFFDWPNYFGATPLHLAADKNAVNMG